jgi:hypothetical protein
MKLNPVISDGNRILFQVYSVSTFLNTSILLCYSSPCPVHFSKEVLDWCKWNVNTLQALLRNFLLLNNFGTRFNIISLISLPKDMSEVILNLVPRKKTQRSKNVCSTRDQTPNYLLLFLWRSLCMWSKGICVEMAAILLLWPGFDVTAVMMPKNNVEFYQDARVRPWPLLRANQIVQLIDINCTRWLLVTTLKTKVSFTGYREF